MKIYEPITPLSSMHSKPEKFLVSISADELHELTAMVDSVMQDCDEEDQENKLGLDMLWELRAGANLL